MRLSYSQESRVTSIQKDGAFWGIAVMTNTHCEWEIHEWTGQGLQFLTVVRGIGSFDQIMNTLLRTGKA
jgi:hypothetical protein